MKLQSKSALVLLGLLLAAINPQIAEAGNYCCSSNFKNCDKGGWCGANKGRCEGSCGAYWIEKNSCPANGIVLYDPCTNRPNACCGNTECKGNQWYKQCVPCSKPGGCSNGAAPEPTPPPTPNPTPRPTPALELGEPPADACKATGWGDPHIVTWDGLKFDVHAKGEFTFVKSLDSTFEVQARTEVVPNTRGDPAVTTGVVVKNEGLPTVQVSLGQSEDSENAKVIRGCPVQLYVDDATRVFDEGTGSTDAHVVYSGGNKIIVEYPSLKLRMDMKVNVWRNTCHFSVDYYLYDCLGGETLVGILGTPTGEWSDDWTTSDGTVLEVPTNVRQRFFQPAYDYAVDNWCAMTDGESNFSYEAGMGFDDFFKCGTAYDPELEELVGNPDPDIAAECGDDIGCIIDGEAFGVSAAEAYNTDPASQREEVGSPTAPVASPTAPVASPTASGDYTCVLPMNTEKFAVITSGDAVISAKTIYTGVAIGGALSDSNPNYNKVFSSNSDSGKSYINSIDGTVNYNFNGQGREVGVTLSDAGINFAQFEWLAQNAKTSSNVIVRTSGGTFSTYDFVSGGQGEDNGNTLVIFNTDEEVILDKTHDGRQFGPSVIAPFSHVKVLGSAGFVDGTIVAKTFETTASTQLQLHGDTYDGSLSCNTAPVASPTAPVSSPTAPAASPTAPVTTPTAPVPSPTAPVTTPTAPTEGGTPTESGSLGDPHFRTWKNEHYEYHGQCDMVLVRDLDFAGGLGLDVQIRTKLVRFWSYIQQAAIRIGDDILEIRGSGDELDKYQLHYWLNFEYQAELTTIGGFPVILDFPRLNKRRLTIDLSSKFPGQMIEISAWKEFVRVDFLNGSEESYGNTVGLLGEFKTGKTLARDGVTVIDDFTVLGNEWQVLPTDDMLFHDSAEPQFPRKCIEPEDPQGERRRRLDEETVSEEQAEQACSALSDPIDRKDCIYDILATQDVEMVGAY